LLQPAHQDSALGNNHDTFKAIKQACSGIIFIGVTLGLKLVLSFAFYFLRRRPALNAYDAERKIGLPFPQELGYNDPALVEGQEIFEVILLGERRG
jgi:hypothetical protein